MHIWFVTESIIDVFKVTYLLGCTAY